MSERLVVLVTGAGGHLGSAISASLACRGACLVLADVNQAALDRLADRLGLEVGRAETVPGNVTSDADVAEMIESAMQVFGRLDVVVNNAGVEGPVKPAEALEMAEVFELYQVNVFGVLRVMKAVLPHFRDRGAGRIVNIASGAGITGSAYMAAYSSSKFAVIGLTRSVALEVADQNIQVNAVCPGGIESPMMHRIEDAIGDLRGAPVSFEGSIPVGRYARAEEVAELVAYLAVEAPSYITGSTLVIDGAMRA